MATVERLEKSRVKLTVEVGADVFDDALQKAYFKMKGRYNVPGFRKGKAPRKVIEGMFGEGVFYEDAFDIVYPGAYRSAIEENGLDPVASPDLAIDQIGKGELLVFTAEVDVYPEVTLGEYKGIEVVKREYTVLEKDVDALIEKEREKVMRFVDQDRPIENGDRVVLDYSGSVDGVKFDGGTAEKHALVIGSNTFIPGFEEQLIGMGKAEKKDITVTFPEEYHSKELAGKEAVFSILIHEIQTKELPELDDEFAQDVSEFDTLEELLADKRATLEKRNADRAKAEMEDDAIRKTIENASFEVPESMIQRQVDQLLYDMQYRLSMSGISLEQYAQYTGVDINKMREDYRAPATDRVNTHLVLEAVAKSEGFEPTEEELKQEMADYCARTGTDPEKFMNEHGSDEKDYFSERVRIEKAISVIMGSAVYVEAPKDGEPAEKNSKTASKSAAKKAPKKSAEESDVESDKAEKPAKKSAGKKKTSED